MADVNYSDKEDGDPFTASDANALKEAVNSKFDEDDVGGANGLVRAGADGRVPTSLLPTRTMFAPTVDTPSEYVQGPDQVWRAPSGAAIPDVVAGLVAQPVGERLPASALDPEGGTGYALVQVSLAGLSVGATVSLTIEEIRNGVLLASPNITATDPDLPDQMVLDTHFSAPEYDAEGQEISVNIITAPDSALPVETYVLACDGSLETVTIPADAAMPYAAPFTPGVFREIWEWGVSSWTADVRIRAHSADGDGVPSTPYTMTVDQSETFFIADDDWTFTEERDSTTAGGITGRPRITVDGSRSVPDGVALRYYMGTLPYAAANFGTIHDEANSPLITPGDNVLGAASTNEAGTTLFGILLWREDDAVAWHPASTQKSFEVQGLIATGAPANTALPEITGTGKIGASHTVSTGTWTNSPTSYAYQAYRDGVEIEDEDANAYTPTADDDLTNLTWVVTATNAAGSTTATTAATAITYTAPTVGGSVADQTFDQASGSYESVDLTGVFTGSDLTIEIVDGPVSGTTPIVTVNDADNALSIALSSVLAAEEITVRAKNSGGSASTTFDLEIEAVSAAAVPAYRAVGGSNSAGNPVFTNYLEDDMIFALVLRTSNAGWTKPDLAPFTGQYLWNEIYYGTTTGFSAGLYWRRADSAGLDGSLGDWGSGRPTYISISGVDWSDPIGVISTGVSPFQTGGTNMDHPGLTTLESTNSLILVLAGLTSAVTSQRPGLRTGATELAFNAGSGPRKTVAVGSTIPATTWAAATDVDHTVTTASSGSQFAAAIEIKGVDAGALDWPSVSFAGKWDVVEVTDPDEATDEGFTGESGHLKFTTASDITIAATVSTEDFTLIREIMGGETPAPNASGTDVEQDQTWYSSGARPVGGYAYPRLWWKHDASGVMKLAAEIPPFEIVGLDDPQTSTWPTPLYVGTGENQALYKPGGTFWYPLPSYENQDQSSSSAEGYTGNIATRGLAMGPTAYASFAGNTATDAFVLASAREGIKGSKCISAQGAYPMQHDLGWMIGCYFLKQTPRLWTGEGGLNSTERTAITLTMKAGMIAGAVVGREAGESHKNLMGRANSASLDANPNLRCAQRFAVLVGAAFLGGAKAGKDFLDGITEANLGTFYDDLVAAGLTNTAKSFASGRPSNAPTRAFMAGKCKNWTTSGFDLTQVADIVKTEVEWAYGKVVKLEIPDCDGRGKVKGAASAALTALVGQTGMSRELDSRDDKGGRSSFEYEAGPFRFVNGTLLVMLVSGMLTRTNAKLIAAVNRTRVGAAMMRECSRNSVGWLNYAQGGTGSSHDWFWDGRVQGSRYLYGLLPYFGMHDVVIAIMDQTTPTNAYPASYFDD